MISIVYYTQEYTVYVIKKYNYDLSVFDFIKRKNDKILTFIKYKSNKKRYMMKFLILFFNSILC